MIEIAQLAGTLTSIPLALFLVALFFSLPIVGYQVLKRRVLGR